VDQKPQTRLAASGFVFDELIICGNTAEASGQHLLQVANNVEIEERHPASSEFLEAPDGVEMSIPSELAQGTAAGPPFERRLISERRVEQDDWSSSRA